MTVLSFWAHRLLVTEHGLSYCPTCGGAEGSLPEHCPQRRMTQDEEEAVYEDRLDYRRGVWTTWTRAHTARVKRLLRD